MRKLTTEDRAAILNALVEGVSVNATARLCRCSKVTVLRLLADAGTICRRFHDEQVQNVASKRIQCDEIWSFCYAKQKNVPADRRGELGVGDTWTWTAIDADSKLVVAYSIGWRDASTAAEFMDDVASRLANRVQLTTDGLRLYLEAVEGAFGGAVDYAMLVKLYGEARPGEARYSPAVCQGCKKTSIVGRPDREHVSTSYVERQNLTMRMKTRRFTRLTNAFSKKIENHEHAVALHYFHYNFCRKHQTLKMTPPVAAGIANRTMTLLDLVKMIEEHEAATGGRVTDYLPSLKKDQSK